MEQGIKTTPAVEVWRPVRNFEGLYEVSNLARVRSVSRWVQAGTTKRLATSTILKSHPLPSGYLTVTLKDKRRTATVTIHRLVAEAFVSNPNNLQDVNHKDECKTNNLPENLEWCDGEYNTNYGTAMKRMAAKRAKVVEQYTLDGVLVATYLGVPAAARATGFTRPNIDRAVRHPNQTANGYRWRFAN